MEPQALTRFTDATATVADLMKLVADFVAEREWEPFHDAKNLSASIAIEAAELMEHFQWLRSDELGDVRRDTAKMQEIAEETADIAAYLLSFASRMGIDLSAALADKMQKNAHKYGCIPNFVAITQPGGAGGRPRRRPTCG